MFQQNLDKQISRIKALSGFVMPAKEAEMAFKLVNLAKSSAEHKPLVVAAVRQELWNHENMHVRRVAVNFIRRLEDFSFPGLAEDLTAKLSDSKSWVQYDAAWAVGMANIQTPEAITALKLLADGMTAPSEDEKKKLLENRWGDAALQAQIEAAETLKKFGL